MRGARGLGCVVPAVAFVSLAATAVLYFALSARMPEDAPLARMYRAESDVAALRKALDTYHGLHGVYPPGGAEGLRMATDALSRNVQYFPAGPQPDPWGRPFVYVPAPEYTPQNAFRGPGGYLEPDTYQLHSAGADGDPGLDNPGSRADNINSWDTTRGWRKHYASLNAEWKASTDHAP
jgi:hypothetical protein